MRDMGAKDPLIGMILGGFVLREALGSGGSADVYRGESTTSRTIQRAIKVIRKEQTRKLGKRFIEEARLLYQLDHPNIVRLHHANEYDGYLVMVLELLRGKTLRQHIDTWRATGQMPPVAQAIDYVSQAAEGVAFAHAFNKGVVHRDIKPENLFVTDDGIVKVLDFGIARALDDADREAATTTGVAPMGTAPYLPPELWDGNRPTPASDVYSLGMTLFEVVTGEHPFEEKGAVKKTPAAYMKAHMLTPMRSLRSVRSDVPESLTKLVERATAKDPAARYRSAREFVDALRSVQDELRAPANPPEPLPTASSDPVPPTEKAVTDFSLPKPNPASELEPKAPNPIGSNPRAKSLRWVYGGGAMVSAGVIAIAIWSQTSDNSKVAEPANTASAPVVSTSAVPSPSASTILASLTDAGADDANTSDSAKVCPDGMVFIPEGTFQMGSNDGDSDEKPVHPVTVKAFCMDRTEVTVAAYKQCVEDKKCKPAPTTVQWDGADVGFWSPFCNANRPERETHPINCIDWNMSKVYCEATDKRLPTEEEWEYAARGTDGRKYPWPDEKGAPSKELLNACGDECVKLGKSKGQTWEKMYDGDDGFPDTAPVGRFPKGASQFGLMDMAGNVWEWTSTSYTQDYRKIVVQITIT